MIEEKENSMLQENKESKDKDGIQKIHGHLEKEFPVLFDSKNQCCGCGACFAICPVEAISMEPDAEGFLYPCIHQETCIRCYQCLSVCVFQEKQKKRLAWESKKAKEKEAKNQVVIEDKITEAVS